MKNQNITITNNFNEKITQEITLETKIAYTPIYHISRRLPITTIGELLKKSIDPKNRNSIYNIRNIGPKKAQKIIDIVHSLGFIFEDEVNKEDNKLEEVVKEVTLETRIMDTSIAQISYNLSYLTMGELLKKSLDPKKENSIYKIRNLGPVKVQKIIDMVHSYGFKFEDELNKENITEEINTSNKKEKKEQKITVNSSVRDLYHNSLIPVRMEAYGVKTVGDLLKLSTDQNISYQERGIYNIKSLGEYKIKELINYLHYLGFVFEDEKATLEKNNSLENLYRSLDKEFIFNEFYEKIETLDDFEENYFVLYFIKLANSMCQNEYNNKYTNKEILTFLIDKIKEYKKNLFNISNAISNQLNIKKHIK